MADATLREIAALLGGELIGNADHRIDRIGSLATAGPSAISFVANPRYTSQLADTHAGCVIVGPALRDAAAARGAAIVTPDPYLSYARLTQWWAARDRATGVAPSISGIRGLERKQQIKQMEDCVFMVKGFTK